MYLKPLKIRNLTLKNNILCPPLAGITDSAFREILLEFGAPIVYTEMVSIQSLYHLNKKGFSLLDFDKNQRPIGVQLVGSAEDKFEKSLELIEPYNFDLIDVNLGCPVKKVIKSKGGSYLLQHPKLIEGIFTRIRKLTDKPLTAKIRLGWDANSINVLENAQILQDAGVDALIVHARTRSQLNHGPVALKYITLLKEKLKIPVIGNGGIYSHIDAKTMLGETNCDGIMLGAGIIGKPWLFEEIINYLDSKCNVEPVPILPTKRFDVILKHLGLLAEKKNKQIAVLEFRKHLMAYTKGLTRSTEFRNAITSITDYDELKNAIYRFMDTLL